MRILYGVVGEGMGHATRSRVILEHLVKEHEVQVVASGRAHDYLAKRFPEVHRIWGLTIALRGERRPAHPHLLRNLQRRDRRLAEEHAPSTSSSSPTFRPDVVISDFESWSYLYGKAHQPAGDRAGQHADHQPLPARAGDARAARDATSD